MANRLKLCGTIVLAATIAAIGNVQFAAAACINGYPSVASEYKSSEIVATGKVISESYAEPGDNFYPGTMYQVRVLTTYKGHPGSKVKVFSENSTGAFPMHVGREYLLFLCLDGGLHQVDNCGNSDELSKASEKLAAVKRIASQRKRE